MLKKRCPLKLLSVLRIVLQLPLGAKLVIHELLMQVCEWREPESLALLLDLQLRDTGESQDRLLQRVRDVAKYSIKTSKNHSNCKIKSALFLLLFRLMTLFYCIFQVTHTSSISSLVGWIIILWLDVSLLRPSTLTCKKYQ